LGTPDVDEVPLTGLAPGNRCSNRQLVVAEPVPLRETAVPDAESRSFGRLAFLSDLGDNYGLTFSSAGSTP